MAAAETPQQSGPEILQDLIEACCEEAISLRRHLVQSGQLETRPFNLEEFTEENGDGIRYQGWAVRLMSQKDRWAWFGRNSLAREASQPDPPPEERTIEIDRVSLDADYQIIRYTFEYGVMSEDRRVASIEQFYIDNRKHRLDEDDVAKIRILLQDALGTFGISKV